MTAYKHRLRRKLRKQLSRKKAQKETAAKKKGK
jgi:hypothetical protein